MRVYIRKVHDKSFHHVYDLTIYSKPTPSEIVAALSKTRLRNLEYKTILKSQLKICKWHYTQINSIKFPSYLSKTLGEQSQLLFHTKHKQISVQSTLTQNFDIYIYIYIYNP